MRADAFLVGDCFPVEIPFQEIGQRFLFRPLVYAHYQNKDPLWFDTQHVCRGDGAMIEGHFDTLSTKQLMTNE